MSVRILLRAKGTMMAQVGKFTIIVDDNPLCHRVLSEALYHFNKLQYIKKQILLYRSIKVHSEGRRPRIIHKNGDLLDLRLTNLAEKQKVKQCSEG
ncbi:MAG: hypothetical protein P4L69_14550 [Desulfosporosinus sp.]|nr:hypothetical protein [Desulfosporosinus sp.]